MLLEYTFRTLVVADTGQPSLLPPPRVSLTFLEPLGKLGVLHSLISQGGLFDLSISSNRSIWLRALSAPSGYVCN